jgi:hypothetical protein
MLRPSVIQVCYLGSSGGSKRRAGETGGRETEGMGGREVGGRKCQRFGVTFTHLVRRHVL